MRVLVRSASGKVVLHGNGVVNSISLFLSHTHLSIFLYCFGWLDSFAGGQKAEEGKGKLLSLLGFNQVMYFFFGKNRSVFYEFI